MTRNRPSRRVSTHAYRMVRRIVHLMSAVVVLALILAICLNIWGVPDVIVQRIVSRLNQQGIPVDIEHIDLTLLGWRAENVRLYSRNPDDLKPLLTADRLFLRHREQKDERGAGRCYDVRLEKIRLHPSVEWCIGIPEDSILLELREAEAFICMAPSGTYIRDGSAAWRDVRIAVEGSILRSLAAAPPEAVPEKPAVARKPLVISPEGYRRLENALNALQLEEGASLRIGFQLDPSNLSASRCSLLAEAGAFRFREVSFSKASLLAGFDYPRLHLDRFALQKDNEILAVHGSYALDERTAQVSISNTIASKQMFLLLPGAALRILSRSGVRSDSFPRLELGFGPARPVQLLNHVDGSFSLGRTLINELELIRTSGRITRAGDRLLLHALEAEAAGQEERAADYGSCLAGGSVTGEVFWDSASHEFGVRAEGRFDPNLLCRSPLQEVRIATNIISRFRFDDAPPDARLELGACYDDWDSFYIHIAGTGHRIRFHDVPFSSVSVTADYRNGILTLDPLVASQGTDFITGSCALDFIRDIALFDATGSMNPASIEQAVYPGSRVFSDYVKVIGPARVRARGRLAWHDMRETVFAAEAQAGRVELPMAAFDDFTAAITAEGPLLTIGDAAFSLFGGAGKGSMELTLDPAAKALPYRIAAEIENTDFQRYLLYLDPVALPRATGSMSGRIQVEADLHQDFYRTANGGGSLRIRNGQLADLPLFSGFSNIMRKVIPSFKVFSIDELSGDFELRDGVIYSDNAYFDGDVLSAKGSGSYSHYTGFDAHVQAQVMSENRISRIFRLVTDPILRLFSVKLEGSLRAPHWKLDALSGGGGADRSRQ